MTTPPSAPAPAPPAASSNRWTRAEKVLALFAAVLAVVAGVLGIQKELISEDKEAAVATAETSTEELDALRGKFAQLEVQNKELQNENNTLRSQLGLPSNDLSSGGPMQMYLSELNVVDHDRKSGTALWDSGAKSINQKPYGHSVAMNAGCQNGDGGDFWLDYSLDGSWQSLQATVGISDRSSTQSKGTVKVQDAVSGKDLETAEITAGPPTAITVPIAGVTRLRLFMNDPNSPGQSCGFRAIDTAIVWGDALLAKA